MKYALNKELVLVSLALLFAQPISAAQPSTTASDTLPPNYVGASLGSPDKDSLCVELSNCGDDGRSWKVYSGVRVVDKVMLEGGYVKFGEYQGSNSAKLNETRSLQGYTAAGVLLHSISDDITLFGKAGMLWWDSKTKTSALTSESSGNDVFYGVGGQYNLGNNLGLRAEWERYEGIAPQTTTSKQGYIDMLSVGATFSSL
ncbi:outer membrane beta-barrel protein [Thiolinea disciformis]|uniref:outer membrane beta-barrel protein n=1 Tax=Thiolinea disciformis TaxID=125614 RepID=UPI0005278314|nr:outer membrane beta-barrel protein [Thiolinea disciformis]